MKKINIDILIEPILESFRSFYSRTGRAPSENDITISGGFPCSPTVVKKIFGSMNNARVSAGLPPVRAIVGKVELTCSNCSKTFQRFYSAQRSDLTFCSKSCRSIFLNSKTKKSYICVVCGSKTKTGAKTCSGSCLSTHRENKTEEQYCSYIQRWKEGKESGNTGLQGISQFVRRYLFEKNHNMCSSCGWSQVNPITGKIPLTIDHIDGNHKNSQECNLRLLCPNCHSLTPTYGNLNRGRGRSMRHNKVERPQEIAS